MEIAIVSGKGGTGKSSISAAFATLNGEVVLADCDVDAANLYILFNPTHEEEEVYIGGQNAVINYEYCTGCQSCIDYCRFDAISVKNDKVTISEVSCDGCFLCSHICPENAITMIPNDKSRMYSGSFRNGKMVYGRLAPGEENSGKLVSRVREKAREVSGQNQLSTVILDGPPGIGCAVIATITGVDKVVIVTEPTLSGLHDMQRTLETVRKFKLNPYVIINKCDLNPAISSQIEKWCKEGGIAMTWQLPFDKQMVDAIVDRKSIIEYNSTLSISKKIEEIWNTILTKN